LNLFPQCSNFHRFHFSISLLKYLFWSCTHCLAEFCPLLQNWGWRN